MFQGQKQIWFQSALKNQHSVIICILFKGLIQVPNYASKTPEQPCLGEQRGQKEQSKKR